MQLTSVDQTLQQAIIDYNDLTDVRQQQSSYVSRIYPLLRERFRQQPDPHSDVALLLVTISNQHVPVFAAAYWKPRAIFAIYSDYSQRFRQVIEQEVADLALDIVCDGTVVHNIEADPKALYQAIKMAIGPYLHSGRENPQIALDVTGGTSVMSVGAAMAISLVGGRLLYIPSDPRLDDPTKRQVGTERCLPFDDPYAVFGDLEAAEAQRLYSTPSYDYSGAHRIFAKLASRLPDADGARYNGLAVLAAMYAAWDALDFVEAAKQADALLALPLARSAELRTHIALLAQQQQSLHTLAAVSAAVSGTSNDDKLHTLADSMAILPLLGTLHAAALRRASQGRYDFAALFRYRCLELISQHRLATHGVLTSDIDFKPESALPPGGPKKNKWPRGISLYKSYIELEKRADPLVTGYDITRIEKRSRARNQSVLAHGYRLIGEGEYAPFAEVVDDIIERLFAQVLDRSKQEWEAAFQFVNPF